MDPKNRCHSKLLQCEAAEMEGAKEAVYDWQGMCCYCCMQLLGGFAAAQYPAGKSLQRSGHYTSMIWMVPVQKEWQSTIVVERSTCRCQRCVHQNPHLVLLL